MTIAGASCNQVKYQRIACRNDHDQAVQREFSYDACLPISVGQGKSRWYYNGSSLAPGMININDRINRDNIRLWIKTMIAFYIISLFTISTVQERCVVRPSIGVDRIVIGFSEVSKSQISPNASLLHCLDFLLYCFAPPPPPPHPILLNGDCSLAFLCVW